MSVILNIGRLADNDIVISESYISGQHAQLMQDKNGQWFIHDLNSLNGTFVNGTKVTSPTPLAENDTVLLGGSMLQWKVIFNKYKITAPAQEVVSTKKVYTYKSRWAHYLLALATAAVLFLIFFLVNEFVVNSETKNNTVVKSTGGSDTVKTTQSGATRNDADNGKQVPPNIDYDLSCVTISDNKSVDHAVTVLDELKKKYVKNSRVTVSLQEEIDYGNENHSSLLMGNSVLTNANSRHLEQILSLIVAKIPNPRGFSYKVFLITGKEINSWTLGGRIYFTEGMLDFTKNDDEIAGVLGHEIYHNELMHINAMLKEEKLVKQNVGSAHAQIISNIDRILSSPFAKKDEALCDLKGIDLIIAAGYQPCNVVNLWGRMAKIEGNYTMAQNFTRGHPYAATRVICIKNHLQTNYNINCE